jgi:hypothetical protein
LTNTTTTTAAEKLEKRRLTQAIIDGSLEVEKLTQEMEEINPFESADAWKKTKRLEAARQVMIEQLEIIHKAIRALQLQRYDLCQK